MRGKLLIIFAIFAQVISALPVPTKKDAKDFERKQGQRSPLHRHLLSLNDDDAGRLSDEDKEVRNQLMVDRRDWEQHVADPSIPSKIIEEAKGVLGGYGRDIRYRTF